MFKETFSGKKVIVTGHTGFKGSWMTAWLNQLGAEVHGIALSPPTKPSHFEVINLEKDISHNIQDIREFSEVSKLIDSIKPDFLFHLAAQPIVRDSYMDPIKTYETNVIGSLNILESLRNLENACTAVMVTSDKCYDNVEWEWGYREHDKLGGPDPYSASKGAAEIVINSHVKSFFSEDLSIRVASARAGNVIGGGDWAQDRIVPDSVLAWSKGIEVDLRNPHSTRPWQHVLEPIGGYLKLASELSKNPKLHGEPFNFGPSTDQDFSVLNLVEQMTSKWPGTKYKDVSKKDTGPKESGLLKLNCDKALFHLGWKAVLSFEETVSLLTDWYKSYYNEPDLIKTLTYKQISLYEGLAEERW